jgi:hypothetical protein
MILGGAQYNVTILHVSSFLDEVSFYAEHGNFTLSAGENVRLVASADDVVKPKQLTDCMAL